MALSPSHTGPRIREGILLKVVILGDGGVGKSCLMNRFVSNQFDEHSFHTIGVEFLNKDLSINGTVYTLQIWDTAGQERFRTLRTPFYRGSDICMLTFAVNDRASFQNLKLWKKEFKHYADIKEDIKFPFVVVANKSDVEHQEREVSKTEMEKWCIDNHVVACIETSAKNANNVKEAFNMAVQRWIEMEAKADRSQIASEHDDAIMVNLSRNKPNNRWSECGSCFRN